MGFGVGGRKRTVGFGDIGKEFGTGEGDDWGDGADVLRGYHGGSEDALCAECAELLQYAEVRLEKCPFGVDKGPCSKCEELVGQATTLQDPVCDRAASGPRATRHEPRATSHGPRTTGHEPRAVAAALIAAGTTTLDRGPRATGRRCFRKHSGNRGPTLAASSARR